MKKLYACAMAAVCSAACLSFEAAAQVSITAKLQDSLVLDLNGNGQANPGDRIRYKATIRNTGTTNATGVSYNNPIPGNTAAFGSVKTSALAMVDSFTVAYNTTFSAGNVLSNDYGLPSVTVSTFGPATTPSARAAGTSGVTTANGTLTVSSTGTFTYTPPTGFTGYDRFAYKATTGNAPDNDALVVLRVGTPASAVADNYTVTGNVRIAPAAGALFTNDGGNGLTVTAVNGSTTSVGTAVTLAQGGTLNVAANGSFTYNPPAGYEGTETFTYTANNGFAAPSTATVTLTISNMIWFVNNNAATNGDGRLSSPFKLLTDFTSVNDGTGNHPAANDNIFLYESATAYSGALTLLNGQKLIGQDTTAGLATLAGITLAPNSNSLPAMNAGGNTTTITSTGTAVTLGTGNAIYSLTIGNSTTSALSGTGFGTLTVGNLKINTTGQAMNLSTGTINGTCASVTSTGGANNISLTGIGGSYTIGGGSLSGATGTAVNISGGNGTATLACSVSQATTGQRAVNIAGATGGTLSFTGAITSTGSSTGINLSNNTGAAIDFSGTLTLTTAANAAFSATGGGTVTATGSNSALTTTTATALNIANTTIGAAGFTLKSVSSNGAPNGIVLSNTGAAGGLSVTGDGATAGSGGTIQNAAGADGAMAGNGIYLTNTRNASLSFMQLNDHQNNGIYGESITGLTVSNTRITGNIGTNNTSTYEESPVHLVNAGGSVLVKGSRLNGGAWNGFLLRNTAGSLTLDSLVLANDTVSSMQGSTSDVRNTALQAVIGSGTADIRIRNNQLTYWWANAIQVVVQGSGSGVASITGNNASQTSGALAGAGGIGVAGGNLSYTISGNNVQKTDGTAITADKTTYGTYLHGTISANTIGTSGVANSGSAAGTGIYASHTGNGSTAVKIKDNIIRQINGSQAIWVIVGDDAGSGGTGSMYATVVGNDIQEAGTTANNARMGILVTIGRASGDNDNGCFDIGGAGTLANRITNFNTAAAAGSENRIRINQRFLTSASFPGYLGGNADTTALGNYLSGRNTISNYANATNAPAGPGYSNTTNGAPCPAP